MHLSLNLLSAAYEGVELGIGDHILMKAIAQATGRSVDKLKKQMEEVGDLGSIAENSKECSRFLYYNTGWILLVEKRSSNLSRLNPGENLDFV